MDFRLNNLKTQGYFYNCDVEYCYPLFFFNNGIYLTAGSLKKRELEKIDLVMLDTEFFNGIRNLQYVWGVFKVSAKEITIERWLPGNGGPYPTQLYKGDILNDSTILISGLRGEKYKSELDTFRFRYLAMKPDSTNRFIK